MKKIAYSLSLATLLTSNAFATVIYSYTGADPMIAEEHCAPTDASYSSCYVTPAGMNMGALEASFTFNTALAANLDNQAVNPEAWVVTANGITLDNTSSGYRLEHQDYSETLSFFGSAPIIYDSILVSTDNSGAITNWQFAVRSNGWSEGNPYPGQPFAGYDPLRIASNSGFTYNRESGGLIICPTVPCDPESIPPPEVESVFVTGTDTLQFAAVTSAYRYGHADAVSGSNGSWTMTVVPLPAGVWLFISALTALGLRKQAAL